MREQKQEKGIHRRFRPLLWLGLGVLFVSGCSSSFSKYKSVSYALQDTRGTYLDRRLETVSRSASRDGRGGFYLLDNGIETFAMLNFLIDKAEKSLDLQYWSLHTDKTGRAIAWKLIRAADRGVRVRVLLDDFIAGGGNPMLAALAAHPNIEVRLFNPVSKKKLTRGLAFFTSFRRINRRMHNKVFIADNRVAILGGRNIGDAYYMAKASYMYKDLDVMSVGPVVGEISRSFDVYWNAKWANKLKSRRYRYNEGPKETSKILKMDYYKLTQSPFWKQLRRFDVKAVFDDPAARFIWADYQVFYDPPEKVKGIKKKNRKFLEWKMIQQMSRAHSDVKIITPYFVPQRFGMRWIKKLTRSRVKVSVITNSFAANDVSVSHGGYQRYRRKLLKYGIDLYEFKPDAIKEERALVNWRDKKPVSRLHAKAIVIDDQYVYIGSVNLTPRSRYMNTEITIMLKSKELAGRVAGMFRRLTSLENSYHVVLEEHGRFADTSEEPGTGLVWISLQNGRKVRLTQEPRVSLLKHLTVTFLNLLPIEDML